MRESDEDQEKGLSLIFVAKKRGRRIRITVFLGAGASMDIGGPSTSKITEDVRNSIQELHLPNRLKRVPVLREIAHALDDHYNEPANFEDVFHALELLQSFLTSSRGTTIKPYKSAMSALFSLRSEFRYSSSDLRFAKQDLVNIVADNIDTQMNSFAPSSKHSWYSKFWNNLSSKSALDIATLNYDSTIEQSFQSETLYDGYESLNSDIARFDPSKFSCSDQSRIGHLHGSVEYGYPVFYDTKRFLFEDDHEDLYKFKSSQAARKTWFGRSVNYSQSGEEAIIGPIITGLRKTDKITSIPYIPYRDYLYNSIQSNSRLLIIGYSFGDIYLNRILERMVQIHGKRRKVVLISYFPSDRIHWHSDPEVMDWPNANMLKFMSKVFHDTRPVNTYKFQSPISSSDGCARIYLRGFKREIEENGDEIIQYLSK